MNERLGLVGGVVYILTYDLSQSEDGTVLCLARLLKPSDETCEISSNTKNEIPLDLKKQRGEMCK